MNTVVAPDLRARTRDGFTLIELIVTVAILAVLMTIGATYFRESVMNARMTGQANDLMADLNSARGEAVRRNLNVYLCTSNNGTTCTGSTWSQGWLVYVDLNANGRQTPASELAIKTRPGLSAGNTMTVTGDLAHPGGGRQIVFHPSGASNVGGASVVFTMCDIRTTASVGAAAAENKGRIVTVTATGRPVATRTTCP